MTAPYYADEHVTLYLGDAREIPEVWTSADLLVTDPPYGRNWRAGGQMKNSKGQGGGSYRNDGIVGDESTATRDAILDLWGDRPSIVFGDLLLNPPVQAVQTLIYGKPEDAGIKGARAGHRRDAEAIYLCGPWSIATGGRTSIIRTTGLVAGPRGIATRAGHPHAKPLDVMAYLIGLSEPGASIADPSAGSCSTLLAATMLGRRSVGVEIEEKWCELAARRLSQGVLV